MTLRLSKLHLRAILILVVSASKGITLVFKNDPLQNVDVSSTFDSVEVIRGYLQQEIEGQLREMFREDLPGIIHRLSQRWFTDSKTAGHVETPYREPEAANASYDDDQVDEYDPTSAGTDVFGPSSAPTTHSTPRRRALHRASSLKGRGAAASSSGLSESPTSYTVFPDIENYDPTYGLRPEGLPTHSGYEAFGRLWEKNRSGGGRGLGSLMDGGGPLDSHRGGDEEAIEEESETDEYEPGDVDDEDGRPFDMSADMDEHGYAPHLNGHATPPRHGHATPPRVMSPTEWESFPAIGGGYITRPRVYHAQSQIRAPSEAGGAMPSPAGTAGTATGGSVTARASSIGGASTIGSIRGRPAQSTVGLGYSGNGPVLGPSLRRAATSHSDLLGSRSRADSLATFALQHSHALAHGAAPTPQSPMRSQSARGHARRPQSPGPGGRASTHVSRTSWDQSRAGPERTLSPPPVRAPAPRPVSMDTGARLRSATDPIPPQIRHPPRERAPSFGTVASRAGLGAITLPLNNSVSQLATLSLSANTLSPYARAHEHIAVRSFPHLGRGAPGAAPSGPATSGAIEAGNVKARRKRIFRVGASKPPSREASLSPEVDERTPSLDWDEETRHASSSSESVSRAAWRASHSVHSAPNGRPGVARASSRGSYGFPKIPE